MATALTLDDRIDGVIGQDAPGVDKMDVRLAFGHVVDQRERGTC